MVLVGWLHRRRIGKTRQGKGRRICLGGRNPFRAGCFALVYWEQTVEFNRLF